MKNVNEILKGEQIDMLMKDLSNVDSVALFLMTTDEKLDFFRNRRNIYLTKYNMFSDEFDKFYCEFNKFKDSDLTKALMFSDLQHDSFVNMMNCHDYIDLYDVLINAIW